MNGHPLERICEGKTTDSSRRWKIMASAWFSKDDYIKQPISKVTCDENILKY